MWRYFQRILAFVLKKPIFLIVFRKEVLIREQHDIEISLLPKGNSPQFEHNDEMVKMKRSLSNFKSYYN